VAIRSFCIAPNGLFPISTPISIKMQRQEPPAQTTGQICSFRFARTTDNGVSLLRMQNHLNYRLRDLFNGKICLLTETLHLIEKLIVE